MRCWWCGIEPDRVVVIRQFDAVVRTLPEWPYGEDQSHPHAEQPPSPDQLEQAGLDALMRIRGLAA